MRSIQRRFNVLAEKNTNLSSFIIFSIAIKGQNFSKDIISRWFNKLVEKNDYDAGDKRIILKHLVALSCPEDNRKQRQTAS